MILGVAGVVIVLPTLVYAFGGPGAREVDRTSGPRAGLRGFRLVSDGAGLVEVVRPGGGDERGRGRRHGYPRCMSSSKSSENNIAMGLAFGPLIGIVLGILIDNIGLGLALGIPLGLVAGVLWPTLSGKQQEPDEQQD